MAESDTERKQIANSYGIPLEELLDVIGELADPLAKFPVPYDD
ncbi:hypothetical protein [Streptomyces coelicoflavus]